RAAQSLVRQLALGDVAGDRGGPDDASESVAERGDPDRHVDRTFVLAEPHRLVLRNGLARDDPCEDLALLLSVLLGNQHADRPAATLCAGRLRVVSAARSGCGRQCPAPPLPPPGPWLSALRWRTLQA